MNIQSMIIPILSMIIVGIVAFIINPIYAIKQGHSLGGYSGVNIVSICVYVLEGLLLLLPVMKITLTGIEEISMITLKEIPMVKLNVFNFMGFGLDEKTLDIGGLQLPIGNRLAQVFSSTDAGSVMNIVGAIPLIAVIIGIIINIFIKAPVINLCLNGVLQIAYIVISAFCAGAFDGRSIGITGLELASTTLGFATIFIPIIADAFIFTLFTLNRGNNK